MKTYSVKEIFLTLQGEGFWAGTPAVFLRFAGCNMWSGQEDHRERDAAANRAECPKWCDTDFRDGVKMTAPAILARINEVTRGNKVPLIVVSGGEPLLQLDEALVASLYMCTRLVAVETNGTADIPPILAARLWVTCSPKQAAKELRLNPAHVSELKVVYPAYDPLPYVEWLGAFFPKLYVQPQATTLNVGRSLLDRDSMTKAAAFCMKNTEWCLSVQTHKIVGLA